MILAEFPLDIVEFACAKCERFGRYSKAKLIERYGGAIELPDLLAEISSDCPRRGKWSDMCAVYYPELKRRVEMQKSRRQPEG